MQNSRVERKTAKGKSGISEKTRKQTKPFRRRFTTEAYELMERKSEGYAKHLVKVSCK